MAQAGGKITIVCGPFTCTLEGFDDPVGAVAEVAAALRALTDAGTGDAVAPPVAPRARAPRMVGPGPDAERLFAATDNRLAGGEAARRGATISHLRAVAAAGGTGAIGLRESVRQAPLPVSVERQAAPLPPLLLAAAQRVPAPSGDRD